MDFILGISFGSAVSFVISSKSLDDEDYNNSSKLLGYALLPSAIGGLILIITKFLWEDVTKIMKKVFSLL